MIEEILRHFEGVKPAGKDRWKARCKSHDDDTASLCIGLGEGGRILVHCQAGCAFDEVINAAGIDKRDLAPPKTNGHAKPTNARDTIVAEYPYHDESGVLLFQAVRYDPKKFRQRRPDGNGGWVSDLKGVRRVLYRLPELLAADPTATVFVPEGEKDVDRLRRLSLVATCNPMGAGKWRDEYSDHLRGRHVVILEDNDDAGRKHTQQVVRSLQGVAASVRVLALPDLPPHGDVSDWLNNGGTGAELRIHADAADCQAVTKQSRVSENPHSARLASLDDLGESAGGTGTITNGVETGEGKDRGIAALPMRDVLENLRRITGDWPRRVGRALFVVEGNEVCWLNSPAGVFGWAAAKHGQVPWHRGTAFVSKEEFYAELQRTATAYDAVERIPHVPFMPRAFYVGGMPEPGDGDALTNLLSRFCPASDIDADLILGMFATAIWGGPPGARPAFVITADKGRGIGKTKLPTMLSHVTGGLVDFSATEDVGSIKARLLSADAAGTRIALLDNVKSLRFSWAELEALITAPIISGKRMYVGEANRPNTLMWVVTLNGASLSTDMAQRSVIIKLAPPIRSASWEESTTAFILENRDRIIADLVGFYLRPKALTQSTRWAAWEGDVLARLAEPDEAQHVILERQGEADAEAEESGIVEDYFAKQLASLGYDVDAERIHIPSDIAAKWFNTATNENRSATGSSRMLKQLHDEGRMKRLQPNPSRSYGRGFLWVGSEAGPSVVVRCDIEDRIATNAQLRHPQRKWDR
ncbi:MAG TPA: hypothetical protein VGG64_06565 [Pirellulales bacterium]|jgi:hypothetical protein